MSDIEEKFKSHIDWLLDNNVIDMKIHDFLLKRDENAHPIQESLEKSDEALKGR